MDDVLDYIRKALEDYDRSDAVEITDMEVVDGTLLMRFDERDIAITAEGI